jgi:hypothetical protein
LSLTYSGTADRQYLLESTPSLNPPVTWTRVGLAVADANGLVSFTVTPSGSQYFYRIHDVTPPSAPVSSLTATAGDTQVSLAWTPSVGATSYNIKSATPIGGASHASR